MRRITCTNCQRQQFLHKAKEEQEHKRFGRMRYYNKMALAITLKIAKAVRISILHSCSESCNAEIKQLRKAEAASTRAGRYEKRILFETASELYSKYQMLYAESLLRKGEDDPATIELQKLLQRYKFLTTQRARRLKEVMERKQND